MENLQKIEDLIYDWRSAFNQPTRDPEDVEGPRIKTCIKIIHEEIEEINDCAMEGDAVGVLDGLGDTLWTAFYGLLEIQRRNTEDVQELLELLNKRTHFTELVIPSIENEHITALRSAIRNIRDYFNTVSGGDYGLAVECYKSTCYFIAALSYKMLGSFSNDPLKVMEEIYKSNMSKLIPDDKKDAVKTYYAEKGIDVQFTDSQQKGMFVILNKNGGKILKPEWFRKPELENLIA